MTTLNTNVPFGVTATDPFGIEIAFDNEVEMVSYTETTSKSAVVADNKLGEYFPLSAHAIDGKVNIFATYKATEYDGALHEWEDIPLDVGDATAEAVDSIAIQCNKGEFMQISVSGHKHVGGSRDVHNKAKRRLELPYIPSFGATDFGITIGIPEEALQSSTWTYSFGHTDDADKDGNFLCGTTHGATITVKFEAIDPTAWTTEAAFKTAGWIVTEKDNKPIQSNNAHQSRTITLVKYLDGSDVSRVNSHLVPRNTTRKTVAAAPVSGDDALAAFTATAGTASEAQSFYAEGGALTAALTVTAPTGFEVSADGTTYASSLTFTPAAGEVSETCHVRVKADNEAGSLSGNITVSSNGATDATLAVSATVSAAAE